jgi:hypothetical protein
MTQAAHGHGHPSVVDRQAEILDLDAEVLAEHTASIIEWLPVKASPRWIVDLGCGTGAGTFALLGDGFGPLPSQLDGTLAELRRVRSGHEDILPGG